MTVVALTALHSALGEPEPVDRCTLSIVYWAGRGPYVNVEGAEVTFPTPITVEVIEGEPSEPLSLTPTTSVCCVRWVLKHGTRTLTRYTSIPDVTEVDFGDLPIVDPASFLPVDPTPTLIQTIDQRIAAVGVPEEQIENAVSDYLEGNPPSAGVIHSQTVASSSWVIPHTFGRLPNVAIYIAGELVETDVTATSSTVTVTFPSPAAGVAVLN